MSDPYIRRVQTSVTNFICCGDYYLFVKRPVTKTIDPGKLNGIGGRLEPGEDYVKAAIRETLEETGYQVDPRKATFCGVVKLEGGYDEDWVMCFFKLEVDSQQIPLINPDEGEFIWLHKDTVLNSDFDLVDDLHYCFNDIANQNVPFFITAQVDNGHKITSISCTYLKK